DYHHPSSGGTFFVVQVRKSCCLTSFTRGSKSDLETWVSVRETPVGTSRDARVSDLSPGAGPEGCGQGSGGCPGGTVVAPGVALRRSPRSAGRAEAGLLKPGQRC